MNETILNGLINLFAIFASLAKIPHEKARAALTSYLTSHFGIRSNQEYLDLFDETQSIYDDPDLAIDKQMVILNVCQQLKPTLIAEEQLLLLLRFMEFAHGSDKGLDENLSVFHSIADIFAISAQQFDQLYAFVTGHNADHLMVIDNQESDQPNHIYCKGLEGMIRVLQFPQYDRIVFAYQGNSQIYMNNLPLTAGIFYSWQRSSVIKSPHFQPIYYSDVIDTFNKNEHKARISLTGRDINFRFKNSENGMHNFSFNLESGQLVAIMGGSGVGKSTLLSLLNGNLIPQQGTICINGHPIQEEESKQLIGFVPQDDLLIEELTVFQNLWYTARLCFANLTDEEIKQRVEQVLEELDLQKISHLAVGSPLRKTISGGQRKRLNIALELIREPAILYLDEPTSGLSSSDSEKVVMLLKEQTHKGKLVVVNIHQPSSEIYKLFDRLWLLDTGGYPIYDGNPIEAITYFKRIANYTDQDISVCSACGSINTELVLNIIDSKQIDDSGNQTNIRKFTPQEWHELYLQQRPVFEQPEQLPLPPNQQKKPSLWKQCWIFLERNVQTKLSNKQYLGIALLEAPLLALIVALLTRYVPDEGYSLLQNKNLVSYIFMAVIVATFIGLSISAEELIKDRTLLKRERFLQLSRGSYLTSKIFYLMCISAIQTLLFILVGNSLIGIGSELFGTWWLTLWITAFLANLTGLVLSQTMNSVVAIYIAIPILLIPQILLCGVVVKFDDLSRAAANRNVVPLVGEVIPSRWAFEALVTEQFAHNSYNEAFFPVEREKFLAQYYRNIHLKEVRDLINSLELFPEQQADNEQTVRNELFVLARAARIEPYEGKDYKRFADQLDAALKEREDNFTALLDKRNRDLIAQHGSDWLNELKREHHNLALEELVLNSGESHYIKQAHHRIYPKIGPIYFAPDSDWGRAPFYSQRKKWAGYEISTFSFNLFVLGFFAVLVIISIFAQFPSKYINKGN